MTRDAVTTPHLRPAHRPRAFRRILTALAVLVFTAAGLVIPTPPPARAALHNIFPADADGTPQGVFYADDALFATMTSDTVGGIVCIVNADVTNPASANCQTGFAWGRPHTYVGIGTLAGRPLSAPPLPVGTWRLLITDTTGKIGTELSETFEVRPCRGTCDTSAATAQLAPWKAKAATAMDTVESLDYIAAADKAMSMYNNLSGVLTDVVKGGGPIGVLMGIGTGMIEGQFANAWDTSKNQAMSILRPLYATSARMWGDISRDPPRDDYDVDTQPVFGTVPTLATDDFEPALTRAELDVMNTYAQLTMEATAYGDASRLANERYMGAVADTYADQVTAKDPDYEAAAVQAKAASEFTFALNQRLRALTTIQPQVAAMTWAQQPAFPDPTALFDVPDGQTADEFFQSLIAQAQATFAGGISDEDRASLKACEFYEPPLVDPATCPITDEMVDYSVALWQDRDYVAGWQSFDATATPAGAINAYTGQLDDIIDTYDLFGRWMGLKAGEAQVLTPAGQPNRKPVAAFTQTLTQGAAPLKVTFTSQATDPDGDDLSLHWDIAGARQVYDQNVVVHTFTTPGTYWIGLTATDPDGLWDQRIAKVEVYPGDGTGGTEPDGNRQPVAAFTPNNVTLGPPGDPEAEPPYEQTFSAIGDDPASPLSYDPDGDALTYTWYFGDGSSYSGPTITKQFDEGFVMSVLLVVSDGWKTAQASGEVTANWSDGAAPDGNHPPAVSLVAEPETTGAPPLQVLFTATATDEDGDTLTYQWDFGDGQADGNKHVVAHTYTQPGTYQATVTVSDGQATARATQVVIVAARPEPLGAHFTVSGGYDAASALSGARMIDTGVASNPSYPVTNLMLPTGEWRTPNTVIDEQTIIIDLAGGGRDLLDRVALTGYNATTTIKTFSVALTAGDNPFAGYHTVIDHAELAQATGAQAFTFTPQAARFLKLTVHDNRGGAYLRLAQLSAPTAGRDGGIVSLDAGVPATVVSASSEYSASYTAANALNSTNSYWSTKSGDVADQSFRVRLGGAGPHTVGSVMLRGSTATQSVQDFEVWASDTGADGSFSKIGAGTLARNANLQEFPVAPTSATYIEIRAVNNHGATNYIYLYELRVLTADGLNVADGAGVGAQVVDSSSSYSSSYDPDNVLAAGTSGSWRSASGQVTDQYLTVLLRNGEPHTVDRVEIDPGPYRPKNVEVQVSTDGTTFTTVAARPLLDTTATQTITFPPVEARFVRFVIKDGYHTTYVGVQRFRVFAADRGSGTAVPFTDISTGEPTSWQWDFGDGGASTHQHPVHTFDDPGTYDVTLTVADADGGTATLVRPYTVPALPTLGIEAATSTVDEGATVPLTATTDGIPILQWDWDLDYSKPSGTGPTLTARFPDDGTYTVRLRGLTADLLWTPWYERTFTVLNVAPSVDAGSSVTGLAMDPITPSTASVSDPAGAADPLTCTWDWGDGSATQTIVACTSVLARTSHTYAVPGAYTATLTADDGDGGVTTDTVTLTALIRATFLQITQAVATGDDLTVTTRLIDTATGAGIPGADLQIAADGGAARAGTTDADGYLTVSVPGASGADAISAAFGGNQLYAASSLTRAVRAPKADIVFVVDESGSMGGKQAAIIANLQTIARGLGVSLDYHLGVVGYAGSDHSSNTFGHVHTALTSDVTEFYRGSKDLVATYGNANGYEGIVVGSGYTVQGNSPDGELVDSGLMSFRATAASCLVLVSDASASEIPGSVPKATRAQAEQALASRGTTVFALTAKDQATQDAYGPGSGLAGQTGGDWWDVNEFVADPAGVLTALVTKCVTKASTPDLSVSIDAPATAAGSAPFTATVTATNASSIDTPHVTLTATLPADLTFDSASDSGSFDSSTNTVTWPAVDLLEAGDHVAYTITAHRGTTGLASGDYPSTITASVGYNGSLGDEASTDNNTASAIVTVQVPEPDPEPDSGEIGIDTDLGSVSPPEAGDEVTYPLTVTYSGTGTATNVVLLQRVPDRLSVEDIVIPDGWTNGYDDGSLSEPPLVGPHPDGETPGTWIYLTAPSVNPDDQPQIQVTSVVAPLVLPAVIDDSGDLDDVSLPAVVASPASAITSQACVHADQGDATTDACTEVEIPVKDIVAKVTVRLSGGITYLMVSVAVTDALSGKPVTLTWTPGTAEGENGGAPGDLPEPVIIEDLEPGRNYVIPWPGGTVGNDGAATGWPGWRPITADDRNDAGDLLDPLTGEVLTGEQLAEMVHGDRILDLALLDAAWRSPSTVTLSVNPHIDFTVTYREVVPVPAAPTDPADPATGPATSGAPPAGATGSSDPSTAAGSGTVEPAAPSTEVEVQGVEQSVPGRAAVTEVVSAGPLARTGLHNLFGLVLGGALCLLTGLALLLRERRRSRRHV